MLPLVRDALPVFADELARHVARCAPELVPQLDGLQLVGRCRCGQSDCATFHVRTARTVAPLAGHGPEEHECIELASSAGLVVLDIEAGRLTSVEVLGRPNVRAALDAVCPPHLPPRLP